jgi:flavin reductase (DIM6/NTAB) family NADH-FMN oxidoreductase RutF
MIHINPINNTDRENYKLMIGSIIPRPIAFVTTESEGRIINGAPFSFFNIVSSKPPLISLSIQRSGGKVKDTARNILKNKEFVVHIVDRQNVEKINQTAASLLPEESEIEQANLTIVNSSVVKVPGIHEAKVRMECILEKAIELGDNNQVSCDLIIGRIVAYHIDEAIYEDGKIDPIKFQAVSRLAGQSYATIGEIFERERPL